MTEIKPIIGICMDMCPTNELQMREKNGLLHEFEITRESELMFYKERTNREKDRDPFRPKADRRKAVKEFSRSSAGQPMQTPEDLRPMKVLLKTTDYLLHKVVREGENKKWNIVYDYIFDRLRSVRQDMAIQCLEDIQCVTILEQCVRFHIYSKYHFGDQEIRLFDKHINETHLRECLQSLLLRYDSFQNTELTKFRPLFEAVYLIYNLGTNEALLRYGTLPPNIKNNRMVGQCFKIGLNLSKGLYYQAIQSLAKLQAPILALLASTKIPELHSMAVKTMCYAYNSPNTRFPIRTASHWLCPFESNLAKANNYISEMFRSHSITVIDDWMALNKTDFTENSKSLSTRKWSQFEHMVTLISLPSLLRGRLDIHYIEE